jgi:hydrogenase maturation factor
MVSLSGGGFFAGLWELSKRTGCGLTIDLPLVPILQETIEITNYLEINPYLMRSAGCLLIAAHDGKKMVEALQAADIPAVCIGTLQDSNDKIIRNGEELRSLDRPQTDALDMYLHRNRPDR